MRSIHQFIISIAALVIFSNSICSAQDIFITQNAEMSFFSEARLENIEATSKKGSSVINIKTREIVFKVAINSFVFRKALMQEHFNETYMESDKYPGAQFKGTINEDVDLSKDGEYKVTGSGKFTLHGITNDKTLEGTITVKDGKLLLNSAFIVAVADYKIDIPNDKFSNISQNIQVKVHAEYSPYVKK